MGICFTIRISAYIALTFKSKVEQTKERNLFYTRHLYLRNILLSFNINPLSSGPLH